jgi:hypothetical protein
LKHNALFDVVEEAPGVWYAVSAGVVQAKQDSSLEELIAAAEQRQTIFYECRK